VRRFPSRGVSDTATTQSPHSAQGGDRFDLYQLVRVAQDGDTQQRAGGIVVAKMSPHYRPGGEQVLAALTGDVGRRLDNIGQVRARGLQGGTQVDHDLLRLTDHIVDGNCRSVLIERTGAGREDQPRDVAHHGSVGIGSATGQSPWPHQFNRDMCHHPIHCGTVFDPFGIDSDARERASRDDELMLVWRVQRPGAMDTRPLVSTQEPVPRRSGDELLVRVLACGVCRTDLHVAQGDLPVHRRGVVPGHEVVGEVIEAAGPFQSGQRVGIAWLRATCGHCRYCTRGSENLCPYSKYTGWDADGGYADYATVPADYAYPLPAGYPDTELAPLLCAGIIGWRALARANLPPGGRLALYGFGASAHLTAQIALAQGARVHVLTRSLPARELAVELGATSAGSADDPPPEPVDSAILFAPAGELVAPALAALDRGGTLAVAGIYLTDIPVLRYEQHLFQERQLRSVTANTRQDGHDFLRFAAEHRLHVVTTRYPLDHADVALTDLAAGRVHGAAVLVP
jgi:propanol-preferring alcohol dehydrogenase